MRSQQGVRAQRCADDHRVELVLLWCRGHGLGGGAHAAVAAFNLFARFLRCRVLDGRCVQVHDAWFGASLHALHQGVKAELRAQALGLVLQQVRELAAIAHFILGQVDARMQSGVGAQSGLDLATLRPVQHRMAPAKFSQHLQAWLNRRQVARAAQQHQATVSAFVLEVQTFGQRMQTFATVFGQGVHACAVVLIDLGLTGTPGPPQPAQGGHVHVGMHAHGRMRAEQVPQYLGGQAGCGPGAHIAGRHKACVGETGLGSDAAAALENTHLMSVGRHFIRRCHADDAGANHCNFHLSVAAVNGLRCRLRVASIWTAASSTVSSRKLLLQIIRPTGISSSP